VPNAAKAMLFRQSSTIIPWITCGGGDIVAIKVGTVRCSDYHHLVVLLLDVNNGPGVGDHGEEAHRQGEGKEGGLDHLLAVDHL